MNEVLRNNEYLAETKYGDFYPPSILYKKNSDIVPFDQKKILISILKASTKTNEFDMSICLELANKVLDELQNNGKDSFTTADIRKTIIKKLQDHNYHKTAMYYSNYRHSENGFNKIIPENFTSICPSDSINEYLKQLDWRVNANANQSYSLGGLILNSAGKMIANYWLDEVYTNAIGNAHRKGDLHIHDLDMLAGYCAGWSLRNLLNQGLNNVSDKINSSAPKHLSSAVGQIVNFLGILQNEWAGAQAFSSFDTYLAPYIRKDKLSYTQVKQSMQEMIFGLNTPSRWGTQTPFTNLTFDLVCPEDLRDQTLIIGEDEMPFKYGDLQNEMDTINKAFLELMLEGDVNGRCFTFPIPTYNITDDFNWDSENSKLLFELTAKYGTPYFQNFINSDLTPNMIRSMCCRLQLDLRELLKRGNGLFGSAEQTGSIGVVTINCARLGYLYKNDEEQLFKILDYLLNLAKESLELKREIIQKYIDKGLFPYTKRYLGTLRNHFSTIGVNGINEMLRNFSDDRFDISDQEGHDMACRFLDHIRDTMTKFQQETGHMYNLEATPAEGTTYRFAKEDRKYYPDIIQAGSISQPYYTNSSQLPVNFSDDPYLLMEQQDLLQQKYTGGTVLHFYMNERMQSSDSCKAFIKRVLENSRIPYITVTPIYSVCPKHGYIKGEHEYCSTCDDEIISSKHMDCEINQDHSSRKESQLLNDQERQKCERWTRVMGYYRPVSQFNIGKKGEHSERLFLKE